MTGPPRVLVVGSANVDFAVAVPRLPSPGETVSEGTLLVDRGGKGANQAVAARRLGAEVRLVGCVGADASGDEIRAALGREGIGTEGLRSTPAAATGTALIVVDAEGRNQIAVAPGANRHLTADDVRAREEDIRWAAVVVGSLEVPLEAVREAFALARRHGAVTILNPAPVPPRPIELWALVDHVTPNGGEAERLSGIAVRDPASAAQAGRALRARGAGTAIVTLGAGGAVIVAGDGVAPVAAFAVRAIDTTAAGDAFNAGLAVGLAEGRGVGAAARLASAAAALACTRRGAQDSLPARAAVDQLLAG
jgi:ribokinase